MMDATVILDAVQHALTNRNRDKDTEAAEWWAAFLRTNADLLEQKGDENDDDG